MPAAQLDSDELGAYGNGVAVLDFWAEWCKPCQQLNSIFDQLADQYPTMKFAKVDADKHEGITERLQVSAVPTFLFLKDGQVFDKVEGASPAELAEKVAAYHKATPATLPTPAAPAASAPTSQPASQPVDLNTRLHQLINHAPVMVFMKGSPASPSCGFSSKLIKMLQSQGVTSFGHFDIFADDAVRQGLKTYSNWPTYPQLYVEGKLIGGLDIVAAMIEDDEFKDIIPWAKLAPPAQASQSGAATPVPEEELNTRLTKLVNQAPVMVFIKGVPSKPQCGFSAKIVAILDETGLPYESFNILADQTVREGLKTFSNWPTYPQLYAKGKLVGGLDIVRELHEAGELLDALSE